MAAPLPERVMVTVAQVPKVGMMMLLWPIMCLTACRPIAAGIAPTMPMGRPWNTFQEQGKGRSASGRRCISSSGLPVQT